MAEGFGFSSDNLSQRGQYLCKSNISHLCHQGSHSVGGTGHRVLVLVIIVLTFGFAFASITLVVPRVSFVMSKFVPDRARSLWE